METTEKIIEKPSIKQNKEITENISMKESINKIENNNKNEEVKLKIELDYLKKEVSYLNDKLVDIDNNNRNEIFQLEQNHIEKKSKIKKITKMLKIISLK